MLQAVAPINYGNIVSGSGSVPTSGSYFYARFTGLLVPLVTGQYTVGVNCQDGCNLFIGEQALVSNLTNKDTAYGAVEYTESGTIYLSAGLQYPITLEWAVGVGGASVGYELQLIWTPPATSTPVLIPATCLTNDTTSITGVLDSSWWNGTLALYYPTGNATIDFANTQHFNKTLDYITDGLTRRILGGSGGFGAATAATATANVATAPADDVIIADGSGNVEDSGVLLSSLVTTSELSSYGFFVNPMTASGDMIYEDPSLGPMRLPIGAEGYVMTVVSGLPAWTAGGGGGFANPMTTEGDMIYENASLGPTRLPIGASGYVMTVVGGIPAWAAASGGGGFSSITTGTNVSATMTVGSGASIVVSGTGIVEATQVQGVIVSGTAPSTGQVLTATSTTAANWQTPTGGGSVLPPLSDFTWVNQGSSTAVQRVTDGPILSAIEDASGLEWRGLFKSVLGAAPYKVQAQLRGLVAGYTNSQAVGLYFYNGTKLMGFEFLIQSSGVLPRVERINSVTSDNGTAATYGSLSQAQMLNPYMSPIWLQLRNDGTDLYFDYSLDGANFTNLWSEAVGSFITPTQYGFGGISDTSGGQPSVICDLLAWVETNNATL